MTGLAATVLIFATLLAPQAALAEENDGGTPAPEIEEPLDPVPSAEEVLPPVVQTTPPAVERPKTQVPAPKPAPAQKPNPVQPPAPTTVQNEPSATPAPEQPVLEEPTVEPDTDAATASPTATTAPATTAPATTPPATPAPATPAASTAAVLPADAELTAAMQADPGTSLWLKLVVLAVLLAAGAGYLRFMKRGGNHSMAVGKGSAVADAAAAKVVK